MTPLEIGIAGAGIGGLSAAAGLARAGHRVVVFDQFDSPRPVGSGLVIQPVGQAVLDRIGAFDEAHQLGRKLSRMQGHEAGRPRPVLDVAYSTPNGASRYGLALHRAALFQAVLKAAQRAGVQLEQKRKVVGVTPAPNRQLIFEKGRLSPPFDLIIDASGAQSPLSPLRSRALPYGAIWGTVDWPEATQLAPDCLSQTYRAAHQMAGVLPIGRMVKGGPEKAAIFWSLTPQDHARWAKEPVAQWISQACDLWPGFAPFVSEIATHDQMAAAFYTHGTLRSPVFRELVHIGDAAHRASPQLGQGANMALLDADALAAALSGPTELSDALERYAQMRRRHLWVYQLMSAVLTPFYQSNSWLLPKLRNHLLAPLSQVPPMPALLSRLVCGDLVAPLRRL